MFKYTPPPLLIGQATDVGRRRHENQDSMGHAVLDRFAYKGAQLLICADGMGGASGGQTASSTAVAKILEYFQQGHPSPEPDIAIREAVELAAETVQQKTDEDPRLEGMGTTCVIVLVHNGYLFAGHIGDSRLYLWRKGQLQRLTRDHSRVQFMVEAGILSEEDAKRHPHQNFLARVLGSNQPPRVELLAPPRKLELGDRLLLCSDGLYNEVQEDTITKTLAELDPQDAANKLVELANANGGNDNITVQIFGYGAVQPVVVEESWFRVQHASHGFLLYLFGAILFFAVGFLTGKTQHSSSQPCPHIAASSHSPGKTQEDPSLPPTQISPTLPDTETQQNKPLRDPSLTTPTTPSTQPTQIQPTPQRTTLPPTHSPTESRQQTTTQPTQPPQPPQRVEPTQSPASLPKTRINSGSLVPVRVPPLRTQATTPPTQPRPPSLLRRPLPTSRPSPIVPDQVSTRPVKP